MTLEITDARIKLMEKTEDRLRGFASIVLSDTLVIRDLKVIEGNNGPFVAMPSRKLCFHCKTCSSKNHLRARFCNQCGNRIECVIDKDEAGRHKLYADVAHPINAKGREQIQDAVTNELKIAEKMGENYKGWIEDYD